MNRIKEKIDLLNDLVTLLEQGLITKDEFEVQKPDLSSTNGWEFEEANIMREMIRHECEVTNERLAYFMALQGFLFTALSFAWEDSKALVTLISVTGMLSSISILYLLKLAQRAIAHLLNTWEENKSKSYEGPDIKGIRTSRSVDLVISPSFSLPILFTTVWLIVPFLR